MLTPLRVLQGAITIANISTWDPLAVVGNASSVATDFHRVYFLSDLTEKREPTPRGLGFNIHTIRATDKLK